MKFINRKFIWLILSLIVFSLQSHAQEKTFDETILSENGKNAYQVLLKTKLFAMDGIGYSGESSEGRKALYELLKERKAKSILAFKSLVKNATIEGGLYGLVGLKMWRYERFQDEINSFQEVRFSENNKETLSYGSGCMIGASIERPEDKKLVFSYIVKLIDKWAN